MKIGIIGRKRHGKDTISDYLISHYNFDKTAFAGLLKEVCRILYAFNDDQLYGEKKEDMDERYGFRPRDAFDWFGTHIMRNKFHEMTKTTLAKHSFWNYRMELFLDGKLLQQPLSGISILEQTCRLIFGFPTDCNPTTVDPRWGISYNEAMEFINWAMTIEFKTIKSTITTNFWEYRSAIPTPTSQYIQTLTKPNLVFSDCRFPNEAALLKRYNSILIKVIRPNIPNDDTLESERVVDTITDIDYTIINNGTIDELYEHVNQIMANQIMANQSESKPSIIKSNNII